MVVAGDRSDGVGAPSAQMRYPLRNYARHHKYSDGKDHPCFGGLVKVPRSWDVNRNKKVLPSRNKKPLIRKTVVVKPKESPTKRIYDLTTGQFKEVISIV